MRILHVVTLVDDQSSYGGPVTVAINQCRELRRRGHDAQILAGWRGASDPPRSLEGVPAHLFPVHKVVPRIRFSSFYSRKMFDWLRKEGRSFDVAHLHLARDLVPLMAGVQLRRADVPYVAQTHGMVLPDRRTTTRLLDRLLTVRVLANATTRFVLTRAEDGAISGLLRHEVTTERIPNGIAIDLRDTMDVTPLPSHGLLDVLFMARLHPRKRVLDFAEAARRLISENCTARFTIIGPDNGDLPGLERFIRAHAEALDGRLTYDGALPHEASLERLRQADVFVLPSIDEPFPMTLLEALAAGTPSICTSSCGVAQELKSSKAAVVVEPGADSLVDAIRSLLASPRRRLELSAMGPKVVKGRFSIDAVGGQLLAAYGSELLS